METWVFLFLNLFMSSNEKRRNEYDYIVGYAHYFRANVLGPVRASIHRCWCDICLSGDDIFSPDDETYPKVRAYEPFFSRNIFFSYNEILLRRRLI